MLRSNGFTRRIFLAAILLLVVGAATADEAERKQAAEQEANAWLELVEQGRFGETWDQAAAFFREAISRDDWVAAMVQTREPLGAVSSRELISTTLATELPNVPTGEYVVLQFKTAFAERERAAEMITLKLDDGSWKVAGYYIR